MSLWLILSLTVYIALQLFIAWIASRYIRNETDYLLAGRRLGLGLSSFSLFATWFGAETVIGSSGAVAASGLSGGRTDPFGYGICLILMAILIAGQMRARNYVTLADYFRERFGTAAEKLASLAMIPTSLIWAAAQVLAFASILTGVTTLPLDLSLILTVLIVVTYSTMGGMLGDVYTDCIQGTVVIIGLVLLLWMVIDTAGGLSAVVTAIEPSRLKLFSDDETLLQQLDGWMIPILGSLVAQEAMSRLLAARTTAIAKRACYIAAVIYICVGLMPVLIALFGYHLVPAPEEPDSFLPALALQVLPPVLHVIFLGALISTILSTIDSALLSATALASHNLLLPHYPDITEEKKLLLTRIFMVFSGLFCYLVAAGGDSIFGLVELASSFGSAGLLVCVLAGLYLRGGGRLTGMATLITGILLTSLGEFVIEMEAPYLTAVAGCMLVYLAGCLYENRLRTAI